MSSDLEFVECVCDQISEAGRIRSRKMFGEFAIYCDDRLSAKPTSGGRAFIGETVESPRYPSAKPHFLIEDGIDDREWLTQVVRLTVRELPAPKARTSRGR